MVALPRFYMGFSRRNRRGCGLAPVMLLPMSGNGSAIGIPTNLERRKSSTIMTIALIPVALGALIALVAVWGSRKRKTTDRAEKEYWERHGG